MLKWDGVDGAGEREPVQEVTGRWNRRIDYEEG